jgi:hypothetical protein
MLDKVSQDGQKLNHEHKIINAGPKVKELLKLPTEIKEDLLKDQVEVVPVHPWIPALRLPVFPWKKWLPSMKYVCLHVARGVQHDIVYS